MKFRTFDRAVGISSNLPTMGGKVIKDLSATVIKDA